MDFPLKRSMLFSFVVRTRAGLKTSAAALAFEVLAIQKVRTRGTLEASCYSFFAEIMRLADVPRLHRSSVVEGGGPTTTTRFVIKLKRKPG
jgi:hypothetical protein